MHSHCQDYVEQKCEKLESSPFVCNGCGEKVKCPLAKRIYVADDAQENYTTILSKSREGANITEEELVAMDNLIYRFTENGQSVVCFKGSPPCQPSSAHPKCPPRPTPNARRPHLKCPSARH